MGTMLLDQIIERLIALRASIRAEEYRLRQQQACPHGQYSNIRCRLKRDHAGSHLVSCPDVGRHRAHNGPLMMLDFKSPNEVVDCPGRVYDAT